VRKADNPPPSCAVVMKSGNLNFLEPSEPLRVCNGTAFTFYTQNQLQCHSAPNNTPLSASDKVGAIFPSLLDVTRCNIVNGMEETDKVIMW